MPAIEAVDLVKTYKGFRALDGLSFRVEVGEIFSLLGPNGAGKSTAVRCLATLTVPDGGRALVAGADVLTQPHLVRQRIGYVSQGLGADLEATGRENLYLHGRLHRLDRRTINQRSDHLLEMLELSQVANRFVRSYSGGMRRRLDIALGLLAEPQVLFLDEPTTGLDPTSRAALWHDLRRLREKGLTILLTTHYLEEADQLADRLVIISRGVVIAAGTPDELKASVPSRLSLTLAEPATVACRSELAALPGVLAVDPEPAAGGRHLLLQAKDGQRLLPEAIRRLEAAGCRVQEANLKLPSLDDVYAAQTGRRFSEHDDTPYEAEGGEAP